MTDLAVDGVSVLLNDVERWRGYLDENQAGEFTWSRHGHDGLELSKMPVLEPREVDSREFEVQSLLQVGHDSDEDDEPEALFFRFAFLRGAEAGMYGPAGVWNSDGAWVPPPSPKQ
jgi:hypothetical protein